MKRERNYWKKTVPAATQAKARWAYTQFQQWLEWRNKDAAKEGLSFINVALNEMTKDEMNYALSRFICEVRKVDGSEYPGATTYEMVTSLQKYLEMNRIYYKLLTDEHFKELQLTLDVEMKRKAQEGINQSKKQARPVTHDEDEKLWTLGTLGSENPLQLVHTMVYLCGVHFVVRGHTELRSLTYGQIQLDHDVDGNKVLRYRQTTANKTNQGGL